MSGRPIGARNGLARDRQELETAYGLLELAKSRADAKAAQLEATLAGMSDGVSMVDADLRLVQWNTRFAEVTGLPPRFSARAADGGDASAVQARAANSARRRRDRGGAPHGPAAGYGDAARRNGSGPDGSSLELRRRALRGGGFVTLYTDITARKQAEQALRRAREVAEQAAEEKSRFVAIVSHEVRTPLNALLNSLRSWRKPVSPETERLVGIARQAGDALLGLLDDILEMSRMDAGRLVLHPALFESRPLLAGALEMFHVRRPGAESRFVSGRCRDPDRILADPVRLRQVLINLLSNAMKFSAPGIVMFGGGTPKRRLASNVAALDDGSGTGDPGRRSRATVPPVLADRAEWNGNRSGQRAWSHDLPAPHGADGRRDRLLPDPGVAMRSGSRCLLLPAEARSLLAKKASGGYCRAPGSCLWRTCRPTASLRPPCYGGPAMRSIWPFWRGGSSRRPASTVRHRVHGLDMPGLGGIEATRDSGHSAVCRGACPSSP